MNKLSKTIIALTTLFVIGFLALEGCNKQKAQSPKVSDFFVSGCNDVVLYADNLRDNGYPYIDTIYITAVDDTKLKISTTNTPFDCCAESFDQEINMQGQSISVLLSHEGPACDCECGHHVDLTIENLKMGQTYMVNIKKDDSDYFQFEVDFEPDTDLMFIRRM